jgi:hypothetical protein
MQYSIHKRTDSVSSRAFTSRIIHDNGCLILYIQLYLDGGGRGGEAMPSSRMYSYMYIPAIQSTHSNTRTITFVACNWGLGTTLGRTQQTCIYGAAT